MLERVGGRLVLWWKLIFWILHALNMLVRWVVDFAIIAVVRGVLRLEA